MHESGRKSFLKGLIVFFLLSLPSLMIAQSFTYPATRISPFYDTIQHTAILDEYKWLEQTKSPEVKSWVEKQNEFTDRFLRKNTRLLTAEESIEDIARVQYNLGYKEGKYYFKLLYNGDSPTASLYFQEKLSDPPMLLVNPRDISSKDRIEIGEYVLSKDEKYLAYQYCRNGTDWKEIRITDIRKQRDLKEVLVDVKFSGINWLGNGFYYTRYKRTSDPYAAAEGQEIWYHTIGTQQELDNLVFSSGSRLTKQISIDITNDEHYMIIYIKDEEKETQKIYYRDLKANSPENKLLLSGAPADTRIIESHKDSLVALTYYNTSNGSIIIFSPEHPAKWVRIVNEMEDAVIAEAKVFSKGIITVVQSDLAEYMFIYDWEGNTKKILSFAPGFSVSGLLSSPHEKKMLFYYSTFTLPPVVFELNLDTYEYKKTAENTVVSYDYDQFQYEKINYPSKDGTMIPMLLIYKKGMKRDGNNPLLLNSYGGFGLVTRFSFHPGLVYFLNEGGVFAYAFIRGEGVNGTKWANSGKGDKKQNSFDDFIAAAEYLVKSGYTKASRLAVTGASNGGLVVGVAITQRPELFRAAVPDVGVYDMLHFENETVGVFHKDEYGTIADSALFRKLYSFSPLHNLSSAKQYPSLLIITSENDDRVPPYHSYKFAAKIQQFGQQNPVLLRVVPKAGHHGADTWDGRIKENAEIFAFILTELKSSK